jgi:hypothetical protein
MLVSLEIVKKYYACMQNLTKLGRYAGTHLFCFQYEGAGYIRKKI